MPVAIFELFTWIRICTQREAPELLTGQWRNEQPLCLKDTQALNNEASPVVAWSVGAAAKQRDDIDSTVTMHVTYVTHCHICVHLHESSALRLLLKRQDP